MVERFRPKLGANFRSLPQVQPRGAQAEARMYGELADSLGQVADEANAILDERAKQEAYIRGLEQGGQEGFDPAQVPEAPTTIRGKAFRQGALETYITKVDADLQKKLGEFESRYPYQPDQFDAAASKFLQETTESLPDSVRPFVRDQAVKRANASLSRVRRQTLNRQIKLQEENAIAARDLYAENIINSNESTQEETVAVAQEEAKLKALLTSQVERGLLSPADAQAFINDTQRKRQVATLFRSSISSKNPVPYLQEFIENSDVDMDTALAAMQKVTQYDNLLQTTLNREDERAKATREQEKDQILSNAYGVIVNEEQEFGIDQIDEVRQNLINLNYEPGEINKIVDDLVELNENPESVVDNEAFIMELDYLEEQGAFAELERKARYAKNTGKVAPDKAQQYINAAQPDLRQLKSQPFVSRVVDQLNKEFPTDLEPLTDSAAAQIEVNQKVAKNKAMQNSLLQETLNWMEGAPEGEVRTNQDAANYLRDLINKETQSGTQNRIDMLPDTPDPALGGSGLRTTVRSALAKEYDFKYTSPDINDTFEFSGRINRENYMQFLSIYRKLNQKFRREGRNDYPGGIPPSVVIEIKRSFEQGE